MTWDHCQQMCWDEGGNITSIHSAQENDFINGIYFDHFSYKYLLFLTCWDKILDESYKKHIFKKIVSLIKTKSVDISEISPVHFDVNIWIMTWIGFRDQHPQSPHQFTWTDGTPFDYTNWASVFGHPNADINYNCGFMHSDHNTADSQNPADYAAKWGN